MDINELLGIDQTDPAERLAHDLVEQDQSLLTGLVSLRRKTMTQEELAERLGVSLESVKAFERYDADPRLSTVRRYAFALRARIRHTVTKPVTAEDSRLERMVILSFDSDVKHSGHQRVTPRPQDYAAENAVHDSERQKKLMAIAQQVLADA